ALLQCIDVRSRSHHRGGWAVWSVGRYCGQAARPRLPGARAGCAGQLDLPLPAADGVLHDARAARDRRAAVRVAVRETDPRRGAEVLSQGCRYVRPADRLRGNRRVGLTRIRVRWAEWVRWGRWGRRVRWVGWVAWVEWGRQGGFGR